MNIFYVVNEIAPIPVAARSKTCICSRSLYGMAGSKPTVCMDVCHLLLLSVVGKGRWLVQSVVCLNECDHEASIVRRAWPTLLCFHEEKILDGNI